MPRQHLPQVFQLQWFGQDAVHAGIQITAHQRRLHAGGQGEDARLPVRSVVAADLLAQLDATHPRQMHIQQNQIEGLRRALHQRLFSIVGQPDPMPVPLQQALGHFAVERHVLDHQNVQRRARQLESASGQRQRSAGCNVTSNQKQLPRPTSLSTPMQPPICSTRCLQMARPNPGAAKTLRDFFAGLGEAFENLRLHRRGNADAVVRDTHPQPLPGLLRAWASNATSTLTSPPSVNLIALANRLLNT